MVAVKIEPVVETADQLEIIARSAQLLRILVLTVNEQAFEILQSLGGKWEDAVGVKHKGQHILIPTLTVFFAYPSCALSVLPSVLSCVLFTQSSYRPCHC